MRRVEALPTLITADRLMVLRQKLKEAPNEGEIWECGVYKGGSAFLIAQLERQSGHNRPIRLFDTFVGIPISGEHDSHRVGDFKDVDFEMLKEQFRIFPNVSFACGIIPSTFVGLETSRIDFAHIDVDVHDSVRDCLEFIYPRLVAGGIVLIDDYGFPSCLGAKKATDDFISAHSCSGTLLETNQFVIRRH